MYKDITVKYSSEFARYTDAVLVTGDVNAYRIVFETPWELDGCNFKVTAKRADGKVVTDLGITEGTKAICVLANSMYSVVGDLIFHLTLVDNAGTVLTACEVVAYVVEGNGDSVPAENLTPILDNVLKSVAEIKDREAELESALKIHQTAAELDHPDGSVTTDKIANGAVSTDKIAPSAVTGSRIANNAVTDTKIADGAITTSKIGKNAVDTDNIKDAAVDSAKILNGSIAARHIIDGQVTRDKIAADSISSDKIANKSVTTEKINDGAVTTEKIADGEISETKLAATLSDKINRKVNKSDLTADNIISVYSSKLEPHKYVNKPDFPKMTGTSFFADITSVIDVGGAYVPASDIDYVWEKAHQNITSTTYFVNYDTGSSSATGLNPSAALKYPSDAMTKAKSGDMIVIMGGYYPRNQLGFDQNKSVHIQGGIFCNADNNRSLTWTLVEGSTYKTTRSQAFSVYQANDDGSAFTEFTNPPTLDLCKSINGSYFIDGNTVYVNTPTDYSGAPGYDILVSLNAVGATINTNVWCENTVFVFGGQAACLNRSSTSPALFSGCTFKYAKQNGFMSQGGKSYLDNCKAYENGRDGFSYKALNNVVAIGFEWNCSAYHNGDSESTGSDNGSTAHDGSVVTRVNGKYYENKGPNIADVGVGTMSYNLNCACSNSAATAQDRQIDFNIEDGTMYLDRCTSDGSFISLYEGNTQMPPTTKSYNLGSVLPGVYCVKETGGIAKNLSGGEDIANKVKSISSSSTDVQYPSAKAVYNITSAQKTDIVQNYANALKGKVTGNNAVRIDDSSPIEHEMNVRVSSKNLIPYPYSWFGGATEKTLKGVTLIVNDDGSITLNGTATGEFDVAFLKSPISAIEGVYTLSGTSTGTSTTYYLQAFIDNKYGGISVSGKETPQYNVSKGQKITRIVLYIKPGAVFNNLVVKPQFERGNVATDYTPYVDPTSVTLTQRGKNLLPYTYASYNSAGVPNTLTNNGITYTLQSDKSVIANGTVTDKQSQFFYSDAAAFKLPNYNIYTLSANNNGSQNTYYNRMEFVATDGSGNYAQNVTTKPMSLTQSQAKRPNSGTYCKFYAYENAKLNNVTLYPQIELGDTYTGYEPVLPAITLTPSADGTVTGVNNIYPTTTLLANKDNVVIDVEYNRDINKAFEKLQNAILAQGSNT